MTSMTTDTHDDETDLGFTYQTVKDGRVRIFWRGKIATELSGKRAVQFVQRVDGADFAVSQRVMAKATGNFKRGNERPPTRP